MPKYNINDLSEFSTDRRVRKTIAKEGKLEVDLLFYEPGQSSIEHKHDRQDEVFYVVSGEGTMLLNGSPVTIKEKDVMVVPVGTSHGLSNTSTGRLIMLFVKNTLA